jgi:hypothetical protein
MALVIGLAAVLWYGLIAAAFLWPGGDKVEVRSFAARRAENAKPRTEAAESEQVVKAGQSPQEARGNHRGGEGERIVKSEPSPPELHHPALPPTLANVTQDLGNQVKAQAAQIEALKAQLAQAGSPKASSQPAQPASAPQVMRPLHEKPGALDGLHERLKGNQVAAGFIGRPIGVGVSGLTESVFVERVVDKTNMVARIRFPELRAIEMAPGWYHRGMDISLINLSMGKAWGSGDNRVWISGIDTTGVVDDTVIYLAEPVKVVDTVEIGGKTIYRVIRAEKTPAPPPQGK